MAFTQIRFSLRLESTVQWDISSEFKMPAFCKEIILQFLGLSFNLEVYIKSLKSIACGTESSRRLSQDFHCLAQNICSLTSSLKQQ